jgi:hypothetical protein
LEIKFRMRWIGQVACMGKLRNTYKILVSEPEGKIITIDGRIILE